jgi:hypothetical protein
MVDGHVPEEVSQLHQQEAQDKNGDKPRRSGGVSRRGFIGRALGVVGLAGLAAAGGTALFGGEQQRGTPGEYKPDDSAEPQFLPSDAQEFGSRVEWMTDQDVARARSEIAWSLPISHIPFLRDLYSEGNKFSLRDHLEIRQEGASTRYIVMKEPIAQDPDHPNHVQLILQLNRDAAGKLLSEQISTRLVAASQPDGSMKVVMEGTDSARANVTNMDEGKMRGVLKEAGINLPKELTASGDTRKQLSGRGETSGYIGGGRSDTADTSVRFQSNGTLDIARVYK